MRFLFHLPGLEAVSCQDGGRAGLERSKALCRGQRLCDAGTDLQVSQYNAASKNLENAQVAILQEIGGCRRTYTQAAMVG